MTDEKILIIVSRILGTSMMLAIVYVLCPFSWIQATHEFIGLGELPFTPLMAYLTRSLSAMYFFIGFLLWFTSMDILRYLPLIKAFTQISLVACICLAVYEYLVLDLPGFWKYTEGPMTTLFCALILLLINKIQHPKKTT